MMPACSTRHGLGWRTMNNSSAVAVAVATANPGARHQRGQRVQSAGAAARRRKRQLLAVGQACGRPHSFIIPRFPNRCSPSALLSHPAQQGLNCCRLPLSSRSSLVRRRVEGARPSTNQANTHSPSNLIRPNPAPGQSHFRTTRHEWMCNEPELIQHARQYTDAGIFAALPSPLVAALPRTSFPLRPATRTASWTQLDAIALHLQHHRSDPLNGHSALPARFRNSLFPRCYLLPSQSFCHRVRLARRRLRHGLGQPPARPAEAAPAARRPSSLRWPGWQSSL